MEPSGLEDIQAANTAIDALISYPYDTNGRAADLRVWWPNRQLNSTLIVNLESCFTLPSCRPPRRSDRS